MHNNSILLSSIQWTGSPVRNLSRYGISSFDIPPKVDHIDQVQWPMNDETPMTLNFSAPLEVVVDLVSVKSQR
jgi:hypothetical protein